MARQTVSKPYELAAARARGKWLAEKEAWERTYEIRLGDVLFRGTFVLGIEYARFHAQELMKRANFHNLQEWLWYGDSVRHTVTRAEIRDHNNQHVEWVILDTPTC